MISGCGRRDDQHDGHRGTAAAPGASPNGVGGTSLIRRA